MIKVASIILAGGQGTRLYPLTKYRAKPAVTFGGRVKLIDIPIHQSKMAGIHDIYVLTQHLSHTLHQHLKNHYPELQVLSADGIHKTYEGTADAIRKNLDLLQKTEFDYFFILSGDQIYELDFQKVIEFGQHTNAQLVIASLLVQRKDARRLGLLKVKENGQIVDFIEKPSDIQVIDSYVHPHLVHQQKPLLGSMGIYLFTRKALFQLIEECSEEDFGKHLIPKQIKRQDAFAYIHHGYWEDIGTISSYFEANIALTKSTLQLNNQPLLQTHFPLSAPMISTTKLTDSIICEAVLVDAEKISNSIIGAGSTIGKGSILENCILCGREKPTDLGGVIGNNCEIKNAIIDQNATIGNEVKLINQRQLQEYEEENIVIKDGIIIVKANSKIPDGFTL